MSLFFIAFNTYVQLYNNIWQMIHFIRMKKSLFAQIEQKIFHPEERLRVWADNQQRQQAISARTVTGCNT